jgi:predicted HD phosphohydrolase
MQVSVSTKTASIVDEVFTLFEVRGNHIRPGEVVSELEHALQAAEAARTSDAPAPLIAAALLHDIGHLLPHSPVKLLHEKTGADWLAQYFIPAVSEPVRLHVAAKRYLCATDRGYLDQLSPASRQSLAVQGGPLTLPEAAGFLQQPHARAALRLRWWDDRAKQPQRKVLGLEHYRILLISQLH